jgi:hypothetical protein
LLLALAEGQLSISYVGAKRDESGAKVVITDRKLILAAVRTCGRGLSGGRGWCGRWVVPDAIE